MIHRIEQDDGRRRLTVFVQGSITFEDIVRVIWWRLAEGLWSYSVIYDESATRSLLTEADLHRIFMLVENLTSRYGPTGPVAVVSQVDATFASAEFYRRLAVSKGYQFEAFREIGAATRWLTAGSNASEAS